VGAYYLYFYLKRREIREHLSFAILCLSVGLYDIFSAGLYNSQAVGDGIFWQRLQLDAVIPISISLIWFTAVFTRHERNRMVQGSIAWFILIFLVSLFASPELTLSVNNPAVKNINFLNFSLITYYEAVVGPVFQIELLSIIVVYLYLFYLFIRQYRETRYKVLLFVIAAQIIYFAGSVNDSLVAMQAYSFIYIGEYTFFFIVLAMAYVLLDRFVNLHSAFEELNINLEHKVNERTTELKELNEQLKRLVERDGLTGIYNRRFFNEYFDIEVRRAMNFLEHKIQLMPSHDNEMNFGLAMLDIDHFKQINDTYGHQIGDSALKQVIEIIERNIFSRDVLFRYGGDEFALLLTKTSNHGIFQATEKIRKEIDEHVFNFGAEHQQHITISVGLVTFDEVFKKDSEGILKLADDRLLRAKNSGRNRIVDADAELPHAQIVP
jgi:diguanylate cyclase (GGDEF)-like protein